MKWCGGSNLGRTRNLGPWKFPAIYESDPSKYPSNGEFESEMAIYCNQARLPMERFGEQLSPQIFNPIFVQPTRWKIEKELRNCQPIDGPDWDPCQESMCILDTFNIVLYLERRAQNKCQQRGFIQQLMETDTKTQSQTLGGASGILRKRGRKDWRNHKGYTTSKPTESINISPTTREHAWDQPRPSAWSSRWTLNNKFRDYFLTQLPDFQPLSPNWVVLSSSLSKKRCAWSYCNLICQDWLISTRILCIN